MSANNELDDSDYRVKQRVIERIKAYQEGEREAEPNNAILRSQLGRLMTENARLREQLGIATEQLQAFSDQRQERYPGEMGAFAHDALIRMSVVQ